MIVKLPLSKITPNEDNPRIIKDNKFNKLVASIKEFPEMLDYRPLILDDNHIILGGNMRYKACVEAGLTEIPCQLVFGWTDEQKKQFIIKDNVSFGDWEWDILANEWDSVELGSWGMDVWKNTDDNFFNLDEAAIDDKAPPKLSDNDYSSFELVMLHENKLKFIEVLAKIKEENNVEKLEDAIMILINKHIENEK
jgi:hypothetical protein|tara:strand:+ start:54 stop:638 length:585 start_codon:yes stop_codon:yes gene_type:complete